MKNGVLKENTYLDLKTLPKGTKLVWDARHEGYWAKDYYYPVLVVSELNENPRLGALIQSKNNRHWIDSHDGYLRLPTADELNMFIWPEPLPRK